MTDQYQQILSIKDPVERVEAWLMTAPRTVFQLQHIAWALHLDADDVFSAVIAIGEKDGWTIDMSGDGPDISLVACPPGCPAPPIVIYTQETVDVMKKEIAGLRLDVQYLRERFAALTEINREMKELSKSMADLYNRLGGIALAEIVNSQVKK